MAEAEAVPTEDLRIDVRLNLNQVNPDKLVFDKRPFTKGELTFIVIVMGYFIARLLFFSVLISHEVPPDEKTHFGICKLYSQTWGRPTESVDSVSLGVVSRIPYAYYWTMGRLLNICPSGVNEILFLRLWNVLLTLATVAVGYSWLRRLTDNRAAQMLFLVIMTNTLMISSLGAAVSYDNLTNLLAALTIWWLFQFFRHPSAKNLLRLSLIMLLGGLTKYTFLPLAAICLVVLTIELVRQKMKTEFSLRQFGSFAGHRAAASVGILLLLGLFTLNVELYGRNYREYGRLIPSEDQLMPLEDCLKYPIFARNYAINQFVVGQMSMEEAVKLLEERTSPDMATSSIVVLNTVQDIREGKQRLVGLGSYLQTWQYSIARSIFGRFSHAHIFMLKGALYRYITAFAIAGLVILFALLRNPFGPKELQKSCLYLWYTILIVGFYAAVLVYYNYGLYRNTGSLTLSVQGRYLFPVIIPIYGLAALAWTDYLPSRMRWIPLSAIGLMFVVGDFVFYLGAEWPNGI